ncbi:MAG: TlyA family RNA methyltransferase [Clostridia bacterium]|nr:TlyA family RNA methyltransferase [Clostridia bacterium]
MRLDVFLTEHNYFKSRSKAQSAISNGEVIVNGAIISKPSFEVDGSEKIEVKTISRFVSRAGEKLSHALDVFKVNVEGLTILDIGASTGGFTDCLLQNGASHVFALDVGSAQIDKKLINDNRVTVIENFNARYAKKSDFNKEIDMIVMDVSFISQTLIYPACADILGDGRYMITLVKPQFEAGKKHIGKGGIVHDRNGKVFKEILEKLDAFSKLCGFERTALTDSPILGGDGNKEYLAIFKRVNIEKE